MSVVESRELQINPDSGGAIVLRRAGSVVQIVQTVYYSQCERADEPIELETADRLALMDFLNMGEYRLLSEAERR